MRRAVVALVVTVVAVILLAGFETRAPTTLNPSSALRPAATPRPVRARVRPVSSLPVPAGVRGRTATGPAMTTPFSVIQVRATVTRGRLTAIETVALSGDGPYTEALNARAEPILREEALRAGSADVDVVSGATSTSLIWLESLKGAIRRARG